MVKDLKRVQIVSADTAPHSLRVLAMDGDRLHGISALDVRARPNEVTTATLTMWVGNVSMQAEAKWCATHPLTGELREIRRIEFADDKVLEPNGPRENKLVSVGCIGVQRAYLNVDREEAIRRYCAAEGVAEPDAELLETVREFSLTDEFECYNIWAKS